MTKRICDLKDLNENGKSIYWILYRLHNSINETTYAESAKELWKKLSFNEAGFHYIKVKAMLAKAVNILFEVKLGIDSKTNQSNALYHDIALMMFDLLRADCYYSKSNVKWEKPATYKKRIEIYLNKNTFMRHAFEYLNYSKRPARIVASIANFLSLYKEEDIKTFLKKALKEYTIISNNSELVLRLQGPSLTLENFPSLAQQKPVGGSENQNHKKTVGAIILNEGSIERYYEITSITKNQFERIAKKNNEKECSPLPLGENTETLSLIKPDRRLATDSRYIQRLEPIFYLFRKHANAILMALSIMTSSLNPGCQTLIQPDQSVIVDVNDGENSNFALETKIRTGWKKDMELSAGDIVEVQLNYKNTSNADQMDVALDCKLPECLELIPGSTRIMNGANPNGATFENDTIHKDGIWIGSYGAGANALIRFKTTFKGGYYSKNGLNVVGRVTVNSETVQDPVNLTAYM